MWVSNHTTRVRSASSQKSSPRVAGDKGFLLMLGEDEGDTEVSLKDVFSPQPSRASDPLPTLWWLHQQPSVDEKEALDSLRCFHAVFTLDPSEASLTQLETVTEEWFRAPGLSDVRRKALDGLRLRLAITRAKMALRSHQSE